MLKRKLFKVNNNNTGTLPTDPVVVSFFIFEQVSLQCVNTIVLKNDLGVIKISPEQKLTKKLLLQTKALNPAACLEIRLIKCPLKGKIFNSLLF